MHHGTCVTHVPWCMSGSLTCGDGENVPGIPGACAPAILRIWQEAHGAMSLAIWVTTLKFLNCENIFKYLIGRLMCMIYHGGLCVRRYLFTKKNSDIHVHNIRQKCHYHMPLCRTNLGKYGLGYLGTSVWNSILGVNINPNVSEFFSLEVVKQQNVITYFNRNHVPPVLLMYNYWECHGLSIFLLYLLHPCWNIRAICETDKQPINPIGFPVTVRPMMVYCCIYNGIYSLCLYDFAV